MKKKTGTIYRDGMEQKHCPVCKEYIHSEARVCLYCKSDQTLGKLKMAGELLVWIGGITAIISLCMGLLEVNEFFKNWREKKQTVVELVDAAKMQMNDGDHNRAWSFVDEALKLSPGSRYARDFQVELAMGWLREIRGMGPETVRFLSLPIEDILSTLYRGAAKKKCSKKNDILAFIAWGNCLRYAAGAKDLDIIKMFEKALREDPHNVYANSMYGAWLIRLIGATTDFVPTLERAMGHLSIALELKKDNVFVKSIIAFYIGKININDKPAYAIKSIEFINSLRKKNEKFEVANRMLLLSLYEIFYIKTHGFYEEKKTQVLTELMSYLSQEEILKTYLWLSQGVLFKYKEQDIHQEIILARLFEESGKLDEAFSLLKKTKNRLKEPHVEKKESYKIIITAIERIQKPIKN